MISAYFEDFTLLQCVRTSDGLGHAVPSYSPLTSFRAGITAASGRMIPRAGSKASTAAPVLVHETELHLKPGDVIRREADGAHYVIEAPSSDMTTPEIASQSYSQVPLKRLVDAP